MVSFGLRLPSDGQNAIDGLRGQDAIMETAQLAERAHFDYVYVTDHPFPDSEWLLKGHHALDPFVALSFAAAATRTLRLATILLVLSYRNPFISAKSVASLDHLSAGRVILGVGTGYLPREFAALGADFAERNELTDEAIDAMRAAWTKDVVEMTGRVFVAQGNSMLPRPVQRPGPPLWVGGNAKRSIRRAVERGDGWIPVHNPAALAGRRRTAVLEAPDDLRGMLEYAHAHAAESGLTPLREVVFGPPGISRFGREDWPASRVVETIDTWVEAGVTSILVNLQGAHREEHARNIDMFGSDVIPAIREKT